MHGGNAYMQTGLPQSRRASAPLLVTLCWSNVPALISLICFSNQFQSEVHSRGLHFSTTVCFYIAVALPSRFVSYCANAKAKTSKRKNLKYNLQWLNQAAWFQATPSNLVEVVNIQVNWTHRCEDDYTSMHSHFGHCHVHSFRFVNIFFFFLQQLHINPASRYKIYVV